MKQKYRYSFRCLDCGQTFKKISVKTDLQTADCPHCKKQSDQRRYEIGDGAVSDADLAPPQVILRTDKYHCNNCSKSLTFRVEQEGDKLAHCYKCGSQDVKYMGQFIPHISGSNKTMIKALDIVGEDTMKAYGMTNVNLNSNMREGDTSAPKLPPAQQAMADSFFNHKASPMSQHFNRAAQRAMSGSLHDPSNPVALLHKRKTRPLTEGRFPDASVKN